MIFYFQVVCGSASGRYLDRLGDAWRRPELMFLVFPRHSSFWGVLVYVGGRISTSLGMHDGQTGCQNLMFLASGSPPPFFLCCFLSASGGEFGK